MFSGENRPAVMVDGGVDNFNGAVDEFVVSGLLNRVRALIDVHFSKGYVERAQRTHTEEIYEVRELPWTVGKLSQHCLDWEKVYNTVRPHQRLGYLTPSEFLDQTAQLASIATLECH